MLRIFLHRFLQRTAKPNLRKSSGSRPAFLQLECLEDRMLPSTITVLNNTDSGPGSLRNAVAGAASGDTIVFSNRLRGQTITLTSGQLSVNVNLSIVGLDADQLTVSGNGSSRVFAIAGGTTVSISKLTIANGQADQGGGLDNAGALTLSQCVVSSDKAVADAAAPGLGGGVSNEAK